MRVNNGGKAICEYLLHALQQPRGVQRGGFEGRGGIECAGPPGADGGDGGGVEGG
eukprot:CAMPEP_0198204612 /NCGR_PEP_ID=MMETSP1445-20131203/8030_1 /TAXON_ID=36898 /ORGANISM="Pyramimonas sp., Strain CCMP2087" /LENGTH=54 /DNA_ID=CAMNT_0043876563 /DNA_START=354 /DNA_END=516 /DNA_ORIENTATION=+